jgi:D-alanine-D-alanine ligase
MPNERVLLLYNEPVLPNDHPEYESEFEIIETVDIIYGILNGGGFELSKLGIGNDLRPLLRELRTNPPDAVFNLFEGLADRPFTETVVAGLLEWFDISFTGCPPESLALARDKQKSKFMMQGAGLPTAPFFTIDRLPAPECPLSFPVIVKPVAQDASVGIEQASVVTDQKQLNVRTAQIISRFGSALGEILVSLIEKPFDSAAGPRELEALPLAEIVFTDPKIWPIYSYDAKWTPTSPEHLTSPLRVGAKVKPEWHDRIVEFARQAYRLLGCRDYARVDFRLTDEGEPFILEVNPNPYINSVVVIEGLKALGQSHAEFVRGLVTAALARRNPAAMERRRRIRKASNAATSAAKRHVRPRRVRVPGENTETA